MTKLIPCPFCGGSDLKLHTDVSEDEPKQEYAYHIFCADCHCHGRNHYRIGWCESWGAAIEAWNDRAPEQSAATDTAVEMYSDALKAANKRITELEDRLSKAAFATLPQRQ